MSPAGPFRSAELDDPRRLCLTPPFHLTPGGMEEFNPPAHSSPRSTYSDEDKEKIIDLIRSLEGPDLTTIPESPPVEYTFTDTPTQENLLDEKDFSRYYEDFDSLFSI